MSDTDGFIEEVTEEVRRDQLYSYMKKYGWIAILLVMLLVGGAAFNEYRKAQRQAEAEALGDRLLEALTMNDPGARSVALAEVPLTGGTRDAVVAMIAASELATQDDVAQAVEKLDALAVNAEVPEIYRQLAGFKAMLIQAETLTATERADGFAAFDTPGHPMRLLASEQLALIAIEQGKPEAALTRLQSILTDAEASSGLQQRAMQVIVALGGEPELPQAFQASE